MTEKKLENFRSEGEKFKVESAEKGREKLPGGSGKERETESTDIAENSELQSRASEAESPKQKDPAESQFRLEIRPSTGQLMFHWGGAILAIASAVIIYFANFWLPYRGITFRGCPSICHYNSDCRVPDCGSEKVKLECYANKCSLPTGHGHFFTAVLVFFLGLGGIFWAALALFQTSVTIVIDDKGIYYKTIFSQIEIPWEQFLGISYRGVHTRLGKTLTLYSLVGEQGMFSFIKKGLPPETFAPRELDLSSFLLISPPPKKCDELIKAVEKFSGEKPQHEEN